MTRSGALALRGAPYSLSIIPGHGNALNLQRKFFLGTIGDRAPVRQNNPLLIFNRNFRDSESARFQRLSALIGRFSTSAATNHYPLSAPENTVSANGAIPVVRLLGVTGSNVVSRVLGVILAALAAQLVLDGIAEGVARLR